MDISCVRQNNFSKLQMNFNRNKDIFHETLSGETNTLAELVGKHFPVFPYFDAVFSQLGVQCMFLFTSNFDRKFNS